MKSNRIIRNISVIAVASLAGASLAACGPSVDTGSSSGAAASGEAETAAATDFSGVEPASEISFWTNHPGGSMEIEKEIIAAFEADSGIKVNLVTAGANYEEVSQKFQTAQATGEVGDVVVLSDATWFPAYLSGSIAPVDKVLEAAETDTSTYVDALFGDYLYEGDHYAVPYARSTPIFYYNKDHYKQAGLEDVAPATWADAAEAGAKLTAATGKPAFGFPPEAEYPAWTMSNLVWGFGGGWSTEWDFATVADAATVEALTFAQDAVKDKWATVLSGDPATDFGAGAVSQVVASTGSLTGILEAADFEVGVGFLPGGPKETENVVPTGGAGVAIASKSSPEKQLAAAKFVSFLTNAESTATFSTGTGYLPVQKDADMKAVYAQTPQFEVAVNQLKRARSQDYARVFLPGGDLALAKALQSILANDADVTATTEGLQEELQVLFDRELADRVG